MDFNIAIISDLHLSEGRNPCSKRFNRNEDFFFDGRFDRFLGYLESESQRRGRKWHLIVAGDMVDFLQVTRLPKEHGFTLTKREEEYGLGTSPEKSAWKMKVMMDGHWVFFKALGRFLTKGNRCIIITGNHDIEWNLPEVQEVFREEMKKYLPRGAIQRNKVVDSSIEFCPWFYYVPQLIWVEHGHQYDGMNSFDYLLYPHLPHSKELLLPGGSFFVRYIFNKVEQKDPFADNIKPISAYLRKYWLRLVCSPHVMRHALYFLEVLRKIRRLGSAEAVELGLKNEEGIRKEADRFGIGMRQLDTIKRLWVPSFFYNTSRLENMKYFFIYEAGRRYRKIASFIRKELGVTYVVFGHTHETDLFILSSSKKSEYANSGTWTKTFSTNPAERMLHEEQESVFVQILRDENDKLELMKWRDELGCGERVNLFE
jgi:UDP-2,3-diacylglucosamine pyrophosphatase LpxH